MNEATNILLDELDKYRSLNDKILERNNELISERGEARTIARELYKQKQELIDIVETLLGAMVVNSSAPDMELAWSMLDSKTQHDMLTVFLDSARALGKIKYKYAPRI